MKNAIKNTYWEKFKSKAKIVCDWIYEKTNILLGKVGFNVQGIFALILLILAAIAAIFITLGIMSVLIFLIVFYVIFVIFASIFYQIYTRIKK